MYKAAGIVGLLFVSGLAAADLSEKWVKRIDSTERVYHVAVQKADNARFYAVQKANTDRLKTLKSALTDATKAGDFDAATKLKELIGAAEVANGVRPKPKNIIKAGGHEYAFVEETLTYHNARKRCQELGGHLVTFETPQEQEFILQQARTLKIPVWIGATNEDKQDEWRWVTGELVSIPTDWKHDNHDAKSHGHGMTFWPETNGFNDDNLGSRRGLVCEWDQ